MKTSCRCEIASLTRLFFFHRARRPQYVSAIYAFSLHQKMYHHIEIREEQQQQHIPPKNSEDMFNEENERTMCMLIKFQCRSNLSTTHRANACAHSIRLINHSIDDENEIVSCITCMQMPVRRHRLQFSFRLDYAQLLTFSIGRLW
jgi:hypothetical protein